LLQPPAFKTISYYFDVWRHIAPDKLLKSLAAGPGYGNDAIENGINRSMAWRKYPEFFEAESIPVNSVRSGMFIAAAPEE